MLKQGFYKAENHDSILDRYKIIIEVKETEKSYIFRLVEFQSRYSATHIEMLFSKSKRIVIRKGTGGHAIRQWSNEDFTFYPFQSGVPFYFQRIEDLEL